MAITHIFKFSFFLDNKEGAQKEKHSKNYVKLEYFVFGCVRNGFLMYVLLFLPLSYCIMEELEGYNYNTVKCNYCL